MRKSLMISGLMAALLVPAVTQAQTREIREERRDVREERREYRDAQRYGDRDDIATHAATIARRSVIGGRIAATATTARPLAIASLMSV
jgi:protein required for attachment to host cells